MGIGWVESVHFLLLLLVCPSSIRDLLAILFSSLHFGTFLNISHIHAIHICIESYVQSSNVDRLNVEGMKFNGNVLLPSAHSIMRMSTQYPSSIFPPNIWLELATGRQHMKYAKSTPSTISPNKTTT